MAADPESPLIASGLTRPSRRLDRFLSGGDALRCLEIIHWSLDCRDRETLSGLIGAVGDLVEAEHCACLLATVEAGRAEPRILLVDASSPGGWLPLYGERQFHLIDPIVTENFSRFAPQFWSDTYRKCPPLKVFRSLAEDFGLDSGISSGLPRGTGGGGSLFSFAGPRVMQHARSVEILNLVLPHLHRALCGLEPPDARRLPVSPLTQRELEVLRWTGAGKSSWEIGMILKIAERTVNFHIRNILKKLDSVNRAQAVAVGLSLGLLELE